MEVAVPTLDEYGGVTEAFCEYFTAHIVQMDALANVSTGVLYGGVSVHIGHTTKTEAVRGGVGIGEAVYDETCARCLEWFTNPYVEFVVGDGTPVLWFVVRDRCHVRGN